MTTYIWVQPTADGATVSTGSALPANATKHEQASHGDPAATIANAIAARNGASLDFPTVADAEAALEAQAMAYLAGVK